MSEPYPFRAPVEDILFSLRAVGGLDCDLTPEVVGHFARFAQEVLAPLNALGDREGCRLTPQGVKMPAGFRAAYDQLAADGWQGLTLPPDHGGQGMGGLCLAGVSEIFSGANHAFQMVTSLSAGAAKVIESFATPEQRAAWLPPLASGAWLATMALTEPQAGSDLAAIRCKAHRGPDGLWTLEGEKIFISGGGQDLTEHILHLVLARSSDAVGVQGLSLFAVLAPSGGDAGLRVTRIEEKLGLHASPTCQISLTGAKGQLIGREGKGLAVMFAMMNHARLDVALQGVAHAARAADLARRHAEDRIQGRLPDGRPARLIDHADVRAMVEACERLAIGARALAHYTLSLLDQPDQAALVDILTPLAKVFCTEAGIRAADLAIQVMGGYGYLRDYGAEQNWRDSRICAIYEGANGIHARALVARGLKQAASVTAFSDFLARHLSPDQAEAWRTAALAGPPDARAFLDHSADLAHRAIWTILRNKAAKAPSPAHLLHLATLA